ncbi:hypothetical protein [Pseudomonas sp. S1(2024)]|uniref:hypothetical protein n=1 Tax=Pseudomonas sp. S1(2024) TaxID=3390191 RepID=UPI0039792AEF
MTPLLRFFQNLKQKINLSSGHERLASLSVTGDYCDVADLMRCLMIRTQRESMRFVPFMAKMEIETFIPCLRQLLTDDPAAVGALQQQGITFLELVKERSAAYMKCESQSVFGLLTDQDAALRMKILEQYDGRLGLDALAWSDDDVGCSTYFSLYHCDLICTLMDHVKTTNDERVILQYLSNCVPHMQEKGLRPDLNWGLYLHPKASPLMLSWLEEHQEFVNHLEWDDYVTAELRAAYEMPFAAIRAMVERGLEPDPETLLDRVSRVIGIEQEDRPHLAWLMSPMPAQLAALYQDMAPAEQEKMLTFGACHALPTRGVFNPGNWEKSRAMVEASFLMLIPEGMPDGVSRAVIDAVFSEFDWKNSMPWAAPLAIERQPAYFLEKTGHDRFFQAYKVVSYALEAMVAHTVPPAAVSAQFDHGGVTVTLGKPSLMNPHGIGLQVDGKTPSLEIFKQTLRDYLNMAVARDLKFASQGEAEPLLAFPADSLLRTFRDLDPGRLLRMVAHDMLDQASEHVALSMEEVAALVGDHDNPLRLVEKMTPAQQASHLESDLGL